LAIKAGVGTKLKMSATQPSNWSTVNPIANITNITGLGMSKDTIDTTALDTTGGYRTFITGFKNPGTLTFTLMFDSAGYKTLKDSFDSDSPYYIQIELPDKGTSHGSRFTFQGLVTEIPLTIPPDDKITCDVTIQISGSVTFEQAA
jgi:predicted secreted protein